MIRDHQLYKLQYNYLTSWIISSGLNCEISISGIESSSSLGEANSKLVAFCPFRAFKTSSIQPLDNCHSGAIQRLINYTTSNTACQE